MSRLLKRAVKRLTPKEKVQNNRRFLEWLKKRDPFMYAVAARAEQLKARKKPQAMNGLFDTFDFGSFIKTATSTIKDVAPKLMEYKAQLKVLDANVKRAQQNLPPLDVQSYTSVVPAYDPNRPTPEQQRLIDQMAQQTVKKESGGDFMKFLPYIAIAGAGAFFLLRKKG